MTAMAHDFWRSCGYRLLTVGGDGRLTVTDDFLRSFLTRPELAPIPESCAAEHALHDALLAAPRRAVAPAELAAIADADARENYAHLAALPRAPDRGELGGSGVRRTVSRRWRGRAAACSSTSSRR